MPRLSETGVQLIQILVTVLVSDVPKIVTFFASLGGHGAMTAQQILEELEKSGKIRQAIIDKARQALAEQGVTLP